jgi:hypothetical protein
MPIMDQLILVGGWAAKPIKILEFAKPKKVEIYGESIILDRDVSTTGAVRANGLEVLPVST